MMLDGLKLVDDYVSWYKNNTIIKDFSDYTQIITPFVNHINDRIQLYLQALPDGRVRISDDGETLSELELIGLDLSTRTRDRLKQGILRQFATKIEGDILYIDCEIKDFPKCKHKLIETIIRVYDLLNTKRSIVTSLFSEEVQSYFFENEFGGTPNVKLTGESSIDYQIDYIVGAKKSHPEVWIQILNHLTYDAVARVNTIYEDITQGRQVELGVKKIIVFNDLESKGQHKAELIAKQRDIIIAPWSSKEQLKKTILT
ncbi:TPA: DUF1828 domain-containing protein [Streptococcus suis]|nr:DUF1828 domain-containing protein [Streptococcus suis]